MGDALLMAMSSSGLANIVLEDFMEVVPAYRISSDTIYELSSSPELLIRLECVEFSDIDRNEPGKEGLLLYRFLEEV